MRRIFPWARLCGEIELETSSGDVKTTPFPAATSKSPDQVMEERLYPVGKPCSVQWMPSAEA